MGIEANTVEAANQLSKKNPYCVYQEGSKHRVIFVGNSITRHGVKEDIGWHVDWGMAASCMEKDYVHRTLAMIEEKWGPVDYCVLNVAEWERCYWDTSILERWQEAREFEADLVIIRTGENIWSSKDRLAEIDLYPFFDEMIRFFAKNPNAQIIVTDLFWAKEPINTPIHRITEDRGYIPVTLGDLGAKEENTAKGLFEHSGVAHHPGDLGMERIAQRIIDAIKF